MRICTFALLAICLNAAAEGIRDAATDRPPLTLTGFGTLGAVWSSEREADFVGNVNQPNGAGHTRSVDFGPDSKIGLQLNGNIGERLSAVTQIVAQHQYDNTFAPEVEWANLAYQATPDWSLRAGRVALPVGMVSDYRLVGYSNPWIRPPLEIYSILPVTSIDGTDSTWRSHIGGATNSLQGLIGEFHSKYPNREALAAKDTWAISDTFEYRSTSVRASFASTRIKIHSPQTDQLFDGLTQFGHALSAIPAFAADGTESSAMANRYALDGNRVHSLAVGVTYDEGPWLLMAEWIRLVGAGFLADDSGAYVTAAYRIGTLTPYATLARLHTSVRNYQGIATSALPLPLAQTAMALNGGVQSLLLAGQASQSTISLGTRWDFHKNVDLKFQYDRIELGTGSGGQLVNYQPTFRRGGALNLVSVALDFVF